MKKVLSLLLVLVMLFSMLPHVAINAFAAELTAISEFEGKSISILGDSISTFSGVSNSTSYNSTIGSNAVYYSAGTLGVYRADTWWQQAIGCPGYGVAGEQLLERQLHLPRAFQYRGCLQDPLCQPAQ